MTNSRLTGKFVWFCWTFSLLWICSCSPEDRVDPPDSRRVELQTIQGTISILLDEPARSRASRFFREQCETGAYDGTYFHRVAPGYLIQGGDPETRDDRPDNDGFGGEVGEIDFGEWRSGETSQGVVFLASSREEDAANRQFFISLVEDENLPSQYRRVGRVIEGMKVVEKISEEPGRLDPELGGFNPHEKQFLEKCQVITAAETVGEEEDREDS